MAALRDNAVTLRDRTNARLIPMVKANAYGLGAVGVVAALERLDPLAYGVATVAEGEELRAAGIERGVILFSPVLPEEFDRARRARLTPTLSDEASIADWSGTGLPYHLSIDTGMSRAGVPWREVGRIKDAVNEWPPEGAFTHFHSAGSDGGSSAEQNERFRVALAELGTTIPLIHVSNSAASALGLEAMPYCNAVRPGIFMYGAGPDYGQPMRHVVNLRARVVETRWIGAGDSVSYEATYTAPGRQRIATVAAGYADGYPRSCSGRSWAVLNGHRITQRGLVTMDLTMFDVTDVACEIGDVVTLIGDEAVGGLSVNRAAELADMSPYELLTGFGSRVTRRFMDTERMDG
ncbi:MAG: alanine racemase [Gemmatimonadota bacterium]|nr:alanine racemase [Gemmatimonadota bacterium]